MSWADVARTTVVPKAIHGVIPESMTLAYLTKAHADKVSVWPERVRAEKSAQQEKRKRAAEEQRVAREKKQKIVYMARRV